MIVRQGMFFIYEKRCHASKCVIRPILGTSFSANRHVGSYNFCSLVFDLDTESVFFVVLLSVLPVVPHEAVPEV